jgi:phenylpyruvate tautomerase PptA (4-oxalocrotonate tautomerase family)
MPSTRIETRAGWIGDRRQDLLEAVQRALVEGIRIPDADRDIRLHELPESAMLVAPSRTERFTFIEISMFVGRSVDAKRRLYAALVRELGAFGIAPGDVKVLIHEAARENWSVGGVALSDVELGFKVEV